MAGRRPGVLGGPGLPNKVRIGSAQVESHAVMEQDRFGRFIKDAERAGGNLLEQLGGAMVKVAKKEAPHRTGRLRNSISYVMLSNRREMRVYSDVPYAGVMEHGSKPHRIHGVRANFTMNNGHRFVWNDPRYGPIGEQYKPTNYRESLRRGHHRRQQQTAKNGYQNWTYEHGATVNHPGTEGYSFFLAAYDTVWPQARVIMRKVYSGR